MHDLNALVHKEEMTRFLDWLGTAPGVRLQGTPTLWKDSFWMTLESSLDQDLLQRVLNKTDLTTVQVFDTRLTKQETGGRDDRRNK